MLERKEREIYYGSWYELNGSVPEGVTSNYISLWAQKMREHDPDGSKADKIAEKYRNKSD